MGVNVTFNGQPIGPNTIYDALEKAVLKVVTEDTKNKIASVLSPVEASQITVHFSGDIDHLSFELSGPDELVARLRSTLGWS